jgi:PAS domain S-box-containing protein
MAGKSKSADEDHRKLHVYTRGLIDASPDMMFTFDSNGVIMDVNKQAVNTTGIAREKLIGSPFKQYFTEHDRAHQAALSVFEREKIKDIELEMIDHKGNYIPVALNASVYLDAAGKVVGAFAIIRDISRQKMIVEENLRRQEAILELSTPALRVWKGIVLMPLIGTIDTRRAQQVMENLLQKIVSTESRVAILDIAGVPVMDTSVAQHLLTTVQAAGMLGAETIITGVSPATAQTMTKLGLELSHLTCRGSLSEGLKEALNILGLKVVQSAV